MTTRLALALALAACTPTPPALEVEALDRRVRAFVATHRRVPLERRATRPGTRLALRCTTGRLCDAQAARLRWATDTEGLRLVLRSPGDLLTAQGPTVPLADADLALPLVIGTPGWVLAASGQGLDARVRALHGDLLTLVVQGALTRIVATRTTPACQEAGRPTPTCERRYTTALPVRYVWSGQLDRTPLDCREWPGSAACE